MRVVFAGTPPFAARALEALLAAGHEVPLVLSQPDRPAGRGMRLAASAVSALASERGLVVRKPTSLRDSESQDLIRDAAPDVMVVAAYGLILPQAVLDIPLRGCINIHASLLPRWRGAAPIQRALMAGDSRTGVGIMCMEAGLDTGPVLFERAIDIAPRETTQTLTVRLAELGAESLVEALAHFDSLVAKPQDNSRATHAPKVTRAEARIDWREPALAIDRRVRAFDPFPGAETSLDGQVLKVWGARPCEGSGAPGTVLDVGGGELRVACGEGALAVTDLQRPGSRRLAASEYLRGCPISPGTRLGEAGPDPNP